jgi:hypothetical protein
MQDDLSAFYNVADGDAELVTVQGVQTPALFELSSQVVLGDQLVTAPTLRLPATVAAAESGACTVRALPYVIRTVQLLPPDGRELLLVLRKG